MSCKKWKDVYYIKYDELKKKFIIEKMTTKYVEKGVINRVFADAYYHIITGDIEYGKRKIKEAMIYHAESGIRSPILNTDYYEKKLTCAKSIIIK